MGEREFIMQIIGATLVSESKALEENVADWFHFLKREDLYTR